MTRACMGEVVTPQHQHPGNKLQQPGLVAFVIQPPTWGYRHADMFSHKQTYSAANILTRASVTLNSRRMYWGMLYSAMGSTTKYW